MKMPKDRRSSSHDLCRKSPYSRCDKNAVIQKRRSLAMPSVGNKNEFEEVRCPICMEHPHDAVLLICSSFEKGCRPYMCNTSPLHSNCFDQFRKSSVHMGSEAELLCPLCRGQVDDFIVKSRARDFMNSKTRSCSMDTCNYAGNYSQLKEHARCKHPHVRPTEIDPEQELEWQNLVEAVEQQDLHSMEPDFLEIEEVDSDQEQLVDVDSETELAMRRSIYRSYLTRIPDVDLDFHETGDEAGELFM